MILPRFPQLSNLKIFSVIHTCFSTSERTVLTTQILFKGIFRTEPFQNTNC